MGSFLVWIEGGWLGEGGREGGREREGGGGGGREREGGREGGRESTRDTRFHFIT